MTAKPIRIQRKRTKGWKMPPNTVSVTRPGPYGNPFRIGGWFKLGDPDGWTHGLSMAWCESYQPGERGFTLIETAEQAVDFYRRLRAAHSLPKAEIDALRGKNIACWCALDQPCHADVLLELANKP